MVRGVATSVLCLNVLAGIPSPASSTSRMLTGFAHFHTPGLAGPPERLAAARTAQIWRICHNRRGLVQCKAQAGEDDGEEGGDRVSVTGLVYAASVPSSPQVTLYTKFQCTLCDKVKDVLVGVKDSHDHSLFSVDISDPEHKEWWDRYKYDIPVLHVNGQYWAKHKMTAEEAAQGLEEAFKGEMKPRKGQPNAAAMEKC